MLAIGLDSDTDELSEKGAHISAPEQIGVYTISRRADGSTWELGRGAMGVTYRAIDSTLQRPVALKMIQGDLRGRNASARERFMREARTAAALRHPNIATVFQFGIQEETGECFYAMELVEGETLEERVERSGPLDLFMTLSTALQITAALAAAEQRGLVHRDLKPGNVMVIEPENESAEVIVKVIDFGLAKAITREADAMSLTQDGFVGTPAFASPEQFDNAAVDVRSDIYSLGATLWFVLTGQMPFRGRTVEELRAAQRTSALPLEQLKAASVPAGFAGLLASMLAIEPAARPNLRTLAQKLEAYRERLTPRARRRRRLVFATTAAGFAALIAMLIARPFGKTESAPSAHKSVAVLPFDDVSDDNANPHFASGFHDDVLVNLSRIADLRVISRPSVSAYKDAPHDIRAIGKALGVNAILEGSIRRTGTRARIHVELIDTSNEAQIWAENYDRDIGDAFALQSDLALQIASALKVKLSVGETAQLQRKPTQNGEAYLLYIQANDLFAGYQKRRPDVESAEQLLERAIQLDPSFALARARLSELETIFFEMYDSTPARLAKAKVAAEEALQLQPDLPEAHMAMGRYLWQGGVHAGSYELARALREFEIAQRSLPNNADLVSSIGRIERHLGKATESAAHLEKAAALDPGNPERWHRFYYSQQLLRNYPAAAQALDRAIALSPNNWEFAFHRAQLDVLWKGDITALRALRTPVGSAPEQRYTLERVRVKMLLRQFDEGEQILVADPRSEIDGVPKAFFLARLCWRKGDRAQAALVIQQVLPALEQNAQKKPQDPDERLRLGEAYAYLGRNDDAIQKTKEAISLMPESKDWWGGESLLGDASKVYVLSGATDLALNSISHLLSMPGDLHPRLLAIDPAWDAIRRDPRFHKLLAEHGASP